ncbi:MAG: OsmC family protein [Thermoplasmata archaeon]|nr:OsmC family protein [Thermoplasmata archaeon]
MSEDDLNVEVRLSQIDNYKFLVDFGLPNVDKLKVDEDPPLGKGEGADPSRLLGAAISQCMLSSLLFCIQKSRARVDKLESVATLHFGRDEDKRLRIIKVDLKITANVPESEKTKIERCLPIFDKFCTVSQSVRKGIPVDLEVKLSKTEKGGA